MGLIKLIIKLLVLPLIVAVTLIQWVGIFFTQFSTVIFNLLAGLMFLITIAGWMFGISAGAETLRLLTVAFSLPSVIMLRKAVKPKLLGIFIAICTVGIIIVGYFFNAIQYLIV